MRRLRVHFAKQVGKQISDAASYISQDSLERAFEWQARVYQAIENLGTVHGFSIDESASRHYGADVRRYVFERTYLIFYHVDEKADVINVFEFRHGARKPHD